MASTRARWSVYVIGAALIGWGFVVSMLPRGTFERPSDPPESTSASSTNASASVSTTVLSLRVDEERAELPARFRAAPSLDGKAESEHYPLGQAIDATCADEEGMRDRLLVALKARGVSDGGPQHDAPPTLVQYPRSLDDCRDAGFCAWALHHARDDRPVGPTMLASLIGCEGPEVDALFAAATAPTEPVERREHLRRWRAEPRPLDPFVGKGIVEQVGVLRADRPALLARFGADAVGLALRKCVEDAEAPVEVHQRDRCLRWLAELDHGGAVGLAKAVVPNELEVTLGGLAQALRWDPTPGAFVERLRAMELLPADVPPPRAMILDVSLDEPAKVPLDLVDHLLRIGRAVQYDAEDGEDVEHDRPLRLLAYIVRPALDGVQFSVFPELGKAGPDNPRTLSAWFDGLHLSATVPASDWFDPRSTDAFINAVLRRRGSPLRVLSLRASDQVITTIAGPEKQLAAAVDAGLVVTDPGP